MIKNNTLLTTDDCLKPHFKATLFLSYIKYIKKNYPDIDIQKLFAGTPITEKDLNDSSLWVSIRFERKFMQNITEVVGKNISYEVGKFGASEEVLGASFVFFKLLSYKDIISNIVRLTFLFNKVIAVDCKENNFKSVSIHVSPITTDLDFISTELLISSMADVAKNMSGYYEAIAHLKGFLSAESKVLVSDSTNNKYSISVDLGLISIEDNNLISAPNLIFAVFNIILFLAYPKYFLDGFLTALVIYFGYKFIAEKKKSNFFSISGQEALTKIELKNQKLQESSLSIERKLLEFEVINKLLNVSINDSSLKNTTQLATDSIVDKLGYDRAFIMLKSDDGHHLNFQCQSGANEKLLSIINRFKLPVSQQFVFSEYQFSYLYNNQKTILVNDINEHLEKLKDPISQHLLKLSGSYSFICVPIAIEKNKYGLLIADKVTQDSKLGDSDVKILENMANQIALALNKIESKQREESLLTSYSKFVPFSSIKLLGHNSVIDLKIGDYSERDLTVLFCDIRNFTKMCESMNPKDILLFLNSYIEQVSPAIFNNNGFIDKFIGDCIMAIFIEPKDAINAAIQIQKLLWSYNISNRLGYRKTIEVAIGIHSGKSIFGPVGFGHKMELTVLSDNVNIASRIGNLNKNFDTTILVSGDTFKTWSGDSESRYLGPVKIRGRNLPVKIYEILPSIDSVTFTENHDNAGFSNLYVQKVKKDYNEKMKIKDKLKTALVLKDIQDIEESKKHLLNLKTISNDPIIDYQLSEIQADSTDKKAS